MNTPPDVNLRILWSSDDVFSFAAKIAFLLPAEGWEVYKRGSLCVSQSVSQSVSVSVYVSQELWKLSESMEMYGKLKKISRPET